VDEVALGRYRLLSVIGAGAMGKLCKAHDAVIGRDVALEVLPSELIAGPGYQERFRREAHTAARLTEPHIIRCHPRPHRQRGRCLDSPAISTASRPGSSVGVGGG
jgi:serine/threonine protein kinase